MSNWTTISADNIKAAGHGKIVDRAQTMAVGGVDPVSEAIADSVARVRGACGSGNALDEDTAKVPNSLKGLTIRLALFSLMERIGLALTEDQRDSRKNDNSYLLRISDQKLRFETPDNAAGSGEMQSAGGLYTETSTTRNQYSREGLSGL